jgi:hypothetical protein
MQSLNTVLFADTQSNHNNKEIVGFVSRISDVNIKHKIGTMLSTYILDKHENPIVAITNGRDESFCGLCPKRPSVAKSDPTQPVCYERGVGANNVWKSYAKGKIGEPVPVHFELMKGRGLRMGSHGDPTMFPLSTWKPLLDLCSFHTGYTSMWREEYAQEYKGLLQASCTSLKEQQEAVSQGWTGTYTTYPKDVNLDDMPGIECPNNKDKNIKCSACKLCDGQHHIKNTDHGLTWKVRKESV